MQQESWKKQIKEASKKLNLEEGSQQKIFEDYCERVIESLKRKIVNSNITYKYDKYKDICKIEITQEKYGLKYFYSLFDISRKVQNLIDPMAVAFGVSVAYKNFVLGEFFS